MPSSQLLQPEERALSTLNRDGSRRWLKPRLSRGRFHSARRAVAYGLIGLFATLPFVRVSGRPAVLLDIVSREFTVLGKTFLPTDTVLMALVLVSVFLLIFLATALFGRVWCGWACPQTVYMEFLYRPIERLFEGAPGRAKREGNIALRKAGKYLAFLLASLFLAHTFLAYFVGVDRLWDWMQRSPTEHPTGFLVVGFTTAAMMFDFCFFREQTCIVACPYGRLQSVMMDRDSLIVTYDKVRGEPRGKRRSAKEDVSLAVLDRRSDCVDCGLCVATCPTGIDIRDGLQMECIGCAQCIDACDAVMTKLNRPRGLIRYSSQNAVERKPRHFIRPRVIVYPLLVCIALGMVTALLLTSKPADITLIRGKGMPFSVLPSGEVANQLVLKIANRTLEEREYAFEVLEPAGAKLTLGSEHLRVPPSKSHSEGLVVTAPSEAFAAGVAKLRVRVTDGHGLDEIAEFRLLGPFGQAAHHDDEEHGGAK